MIMINSTKEYNKFKTLEGNRLLNVGHLSRLEKSILDNNLLKYNPIIVNKKFEVLDGQHRLEVAKRNNLTVYYVVADDANIDDVITLNINQEKWSYPDYLQTYVSRGYEDYIIVKNFCDWYSMPLFMAVLLLSGVSTRKGEYPKFRQGVFKVTHLKEAEDFAKEYEKYKEVFPERMLYQRAFLTSILHLHRQGVDHDRMLQKYKIFTHWTGKELQRRTTIPEYLRDLEEIYNYRSSTNRVRFF